NVPAPVNEPVYSYAPGTPERALVKAAIAEARAEQVDIPMYIGSEEVRTSKKGVLTPPHDHKHVLRHYSQGTKQHVNDAINAALPGQEQGEHLPRVHPAALFLKAAEVIAPKYRDKPNAAAMLGESRSAYPAEIDSACQIIDFLRFHVQVTFGI